MTSVRTRPRWAAYRAAAAFLALAVTAGQPTLAQSPSAGAAPPPFVQRGLPGPEHRALAPLVGTFRVEKTLYIGPGTPDRPKVVRDVTCVRRWVGGGRYIEDVTEGDVAGAPYWREGHLGFSTMDRRYEWVTVDATNTNMMIYRGEPLPEGAAPPRTISASGVFTDQGLLGEAAAGKPVGMRAVFRIESDDRHVLDLYFTPPGGREFLADRSVYTRVQGTAQQTGQLAEPVLAADRALVAAYRSGDLAALDRLFAPDFVFISSQGRSQDRTGVIGDYRSGRIRTEAMAVEEATVRRPGPDVAVVTGRQSARDAPSPASGASRECTPSSPAANGAWLRSILAPCWPVECLGCIDAARSRLGASGAFDRLDTYVGCAGVWVTATFEQTRPEELRRILDVNLMGQAHGIWAALPELRRNVGRGDRAGGALILFAFNRSKRCFPAPGSCGPSARWSRACSRAGLIAKATSSGFRSRATTELPSTLPPGSSATRVLSRWR